MGTGPNADAPTVDVPRRSDIVLTGDTLDIVASMTQEERDALLVNVYRMLQEIVGFVRGMETAVAGMQQGGGMGGLLARQFLNNGNGN